MRIKLLSAAQAVLRVSILFLFVSFSILMTDISHSERYENTVVLSDHLDWLSVITAIFLSYLGIVSARAIILWDFFVSEQRELSLGGKQSDQSPFTELFAYSVFGLIILSIIAFNQPSVSSVGYDWWPWSTNLESKSYSALFVFAFAGIFVPQIVSFYVFSRYLARSQLRAPHDSSHITDRNLIVGLVVICAIALLGWSAGQGLLNFDATFGPIILFVVVLAFLLFVLMPYVRGPRWRAANTSIHTMGLTLPHPAVFVSAIDDGLVDVFAPISGASARASQNFKRKPAVQSRSFILRVVRFGLSHIVVVSTFVPLCALGYALPAPLGLVPITFAFFLAIALGRRWSVLEEDRETAMRLRTASPQYFRVGFRNDLRDEALLGYLFVFILIPLALRQIQLSTQVFVVAEGVDDGSLFSWIQFFGTELAKSVPIVDWAEIYGVEPPKPFEAEDNNSRHIVFAFRLIIDAIVIAALLQAWSIMRRNSDQKRLFEEGHLEQLDPFAEDELFAKHINLDSSAQSYTFSDELLKLFRTHAESRSRLNRPGTPYDLGRLGEWAADDSRPGVQALVGVLVKDYKLLVGSVFERSNMLLERWRTSPLDKLNSEDLRNQRLDFERLLDDAQDQNIRLLPAGAKVLGGLLEFTTDRPEFHNAKIEAYTLLGNEPATDAVWILVRGLFKTEKDARTAGVLLPENNSAHWTTEAREPLQEMREHIVLALCEYEKHKLELRDGARRNSTEGLEVARRAIKWAAGSETNKPRDAAQKHLDSQNAGF